MGLLPRSCAPMAFVEGRKSFCMGAMSETEDQIRDLTGLTRNQKIDIRNLFSWPVC
jgi:hypothetical protein